MLAVPLLVELDLIIQNGMTIACEIKSPIDKVRMYSFGCKVDFYAKHQGREISRKIVISPMVDSRALPVARALGIEVFTMPMLWRGFTGCFEVCPLVVRLSSTPFLRLGEEIFNLAVHFVSFIC